MRAGQGQEQPDGALGVMAAAGGGIDVIAEVAVIHFNLAISADAKADAAGHGNWRRQPAIGGGDIAPDAHPEMILRHASGGAVSRLAAPGGGVQELFKLFVRRARLSGSQGERQRMIAGFKKLVEVLRIGCDEFQLAIDQGAGIEKSESLEEKLERGIAPDMIPPMLISSLQFGRGAPQ